MNQTDLDNVVRIGNLARECVGEQQFADIMTQELMGLFKSRSAVFMEFEQFGGETRLSNSTSFCIDNAHGLEYINHYHTLDPCYQRLCELVHEKPQVSVSTDQVIERERTYVNSDYYQDFMRSTGVYKSLIFTLADRKNPVGLLGFHREKPQRNYSADDHMKAQLVAPYLSTAVMFRQKERELRQQNLLKNSILRSSNVGAYLLFNQKMICIDSGQTDTELQLLKGVGFIQARGLSCEQLVTPELVGLVANKLRQSKPSSVSLSATFDNLVTASHVRVESVTGDGGEPYVLLLLLNNDIELVCDQRMDYFGLTERQKEIAKLVEAGFTNVQISARLKISAKTVENHLTQIYAKTFTHNKTSLLRQLHV